MAPKNDGPRDLANFVFKSINNDSNLENSVDIEILYAFFETLFFTSLNTEEGEFINVNTTFFDPTVKNSRLTTPDKWRFVPFQNKFVFDIRTLIKLSKAADPWSSSLAVHYEGNQLWIYGLIDQALHAQSYLHYEVEKKPELPGLFSCSINGIGILSVIKKYELLATLRQNRLVNKYIDVLNYGIISEKLDRFVDSNTYEINGYFQNVDNADLRIKWIKFFNSSWRIIIARILNQINNYSHGGAILITNSFDNLDIKYEIKYSRLSTSLMSYTKSKITEEGYQNAFREKSSDEDDYFEAFIETILEQESYRNQLKGAIRFIASQSRVDGLVLLNHQLQARGFGVVITELACPPNVYVSNTAKATTISLTSRKSTSFGTRHRSMFAYCFHNPDSIGFVISQDGEIRAVANLDGKIIVWEDIKTIQFANNDEVSKASSSLLQKWLTIQTLAKVNSRTRPSK